MKEKDDILKKAVDDMNPEQIPIGPSKELIDTTLKKLNGVSSQLPQEHFDKQVVFSKRVMMINNLVRIAAVVILSISIGYAAGRISASKSLDMENIQAELEPAIREKLLEDVQIGLTSNYVQLREELTEQYMLDLRNVALEILNASGTITNNLLEKRMQTVSAAQIQNTQMITAALMQTDQNVAVLAKYVTSTEKNNQKSDGLEY